MGQIFLSYRVFLPWVILCAAVAAAFAQTKPVTLDVDGPMVRTLSDYNLFLGNGSTQQPNEGVIPYDLNTPLFSDYATKHRFVWMPSGVSATYDDTESFAFPVGTILVKTFSYLNDIRDPSKGERHLETRLLIHKPSGWIGLPYVWNDEQTEAVLKVAGGTVDVEWIHYDGKKRTVNYILPNMNQCKGCHENADVMKPIGPKARHINKPYLYPEGPKNQLTKWAQVGYLTGAPAHGDAPKLAVWNDADKYSLDDRARAWLDVNCAHCHNPKGPANTSGLDLRNSQHDLTKLGIFKTPVAAGRGAGDHLYDIVPGKPDESILIFRLESREPGIMMPELSLRLVDDVGLGLMREWIDQLKP